MRVFRITGKMDPPLPGGIRIAGNALGAARRAMGVVLSGRSLSVDPETVSARKTTCSACEYHRDTDDRCSHPRCGCYLKFKTRLNSEKCPENKW
jgi:hypothetical protein